MKTITIDKIDNSHALMDVRLGALQLLDAQMRDYGLEFEVAVGDFELEKGLHYVKVVEISAKQYTTREFEKVVR